MPSRLAAFKTQSRLIKYYLDNIIPGNIVPDGNLEFC